MDAKELRQEGREREAAYFGAVLAVCEDAILGVAAGDFLSLWSPAAERLFGYTRAEAVGQPLALLFDLEHVAVATELMAAARRGEPEQERETVARGRHWAARAVRLRAVAVPAQGGAGGEALLLVHDLAPQREIERAMRQMQARANRRTVLLETANRVALDILSSRTGAEALRHITEAARTLAGARYAALGVASPDGQELSDFVTVGLTPEQQAAIGPRPRGLGLLGLLLKSDRPLRVNDLAAYPAAVGLPPNHPPMTGFLGVPVLRDGEVVGALYLTEKEGGGSFTAEDEAAVETLGAYAAVAIYNLRLLSRQRALVASLITAQEEERRAVAYDLHDGLTQYVMGAHLHLEIGWEAHLAGQTAKAARATEQSLHYLRQASVESRRLVSGLRALSLDDLGLTGALEQLVEEEKERAGWEHVDFAHTIAGRRFATDLEVTIYRVAQEALTNARKHARAVRVCVLLLYGTDSATGDPMLTLEVRDDGVGFALEAQQEETGHFGLYGMAERVTLLDGTYDLRSVPGEGTTLRVVLPISGRHTQRSQGGMLSGGTLSGGTLSGGTLSGGTP